jgi:putative ABC transport system permease protein
VTISGFIVRNAFRNKRRLALTVLSVAVSLFLFTTLQTALRLMTNPPTSDQSALRIVTRHRVSLANVLPEKYQLRIERLPGVQYCSKFTWFGGIYRDPSFSNFGQFAVDADRIFKIFPEMVVTPQQEADFIKEKSSCVVGGKLMERFGWKIGDKITLLGSIWPCNPELTIRGVYHARGLDETLMFFHHDYFNELMNDRGLVGTFWIKATSAEAIPDLMARIDAAFRNSDAETKTETERSFQLTFISMLGNVKLFLGAISTVIVFTMLLVTASTMSMAIRERAREMAILKALGFNGLDVFRLILAESFGLAMTGGLIGCFGTKYLFGHVDIYKLSHGNIPLFPVSGDTLALGLVVAAVLGLVSSLAPAYTSIKMSVVEGLQELD